MSPLENILDQKSAIPEYVELVRPAIDGFLLARLIVQDVAESPMEFEGSDGLVFHALNNLNSRIQEQAEGMLVSFVTGCSAASETLSRTVVETSVNFLYLTAEPPASRLFAFFRTYLREHKKRLDEWETFTSRSYDDPVKTNVLSMITSRREGLDALRYFVNEIAAGCGHPMESDTSAWNMKLFERFRAVGHTDSYWTVYHRLSASAHGNAEDTIGWLMGTYSLLSDGDDSFLKKISSEALHYTAMMLHIALDFYLEACRSFCTLYTSNSAVKKIDDISRILTSNAQALSKAAGSPQYL